MHPPIACSPARLLQYIENYVRQDTMPAEAGYWLTQFVSATTFIESLDLDGGGGGGSGGGP